MKAFSAISIPFGIEVVGDYAFFGCSALKKVEFAGSVRKIGECAFALCEKLESVYLSYRSCELNLFQSRADEECVVANNLDPKWYRDRFQT